MAGVWGNVIAGNMAPKEERKKKRIESSKLTSAVTFIAGTRSAEVKLSPASVSHRRVSAVKDVLVIFIYSEF